MNGKLYQRGNVWWTRFTHRGKEHRQSLGTNDRDEARRKLDLIISKIRITGDTPTKDVKLEDLVTEYINDARSTDRLGVAKNASRGWRVHLQPFFQRAKISGLGTADFADYRRHRLEEGAQQSTINRELQVVIASYKLGYRSTPPRIERMPYIKLTKEDNARRTFVSQAQCDSLFEAASREGLAWRVLLEMAYLLGWRRGELLGLHVGDVNVIDRTIRIDQTKNGEAREVPMTERLALLIQQLISGKPADAKIFPSRSSLERKWKKIRAAAGCPGVKFHDWRRTSARTKRAAGVPEGVIMDLQGWKTAAMFRRYAIVNNDDKRKALDLVDRPIVLPHTPRTNFS